MANQNPRGRKKPTTLWPILDGEKLTPRGHLGYLIVTLQIDPLASVAELKRDFGILISQMREPYRSYIDECDQKKVAQVAAELRKPAQEKVAEAVRLLGMEPRRASQALQEVPWPSATKIAARLGPAWDKAYVRKVLRKSKTKAR